MQPACVPCPVDLLARGLAGGLGRTDLDGVDLDRVGLSLMISMSRTKARASISRLRR